MYNYCETAAAYFFFVVLVSSFSCPLSFLCSFNSPATASALEVRKSHAWAIQCWQDKAGNLTKHSSCTSPAMIKHTVLLLLVNPPTDHSLSYLLGLIYIQSSDNWRPLYTHKTSAWACWWIPLVITHALLFLSKNLNCGAVSLPGRSQRYTPVKLTLRMYLSSSVPLMVSILEQRSTLPGQRSLCMLCRAWAMAYTASITNCTFPSCS